MNAVDLFGCEVESRIIYPSPKVGLVKCAVKPLVDGKVDVDSVWVGIVEDKSGNEVARGYFSKSAFYAFQDGNVVKITIAGEDGNSYWVYFNSSNDGGYGFLNSPVVSIPKDRVFVLTDRLLKTMKDSLVVVQQCSDCNSALVMACGQYKTLAVCSRCGRVDHII